jgi:hypothetical protein
MTETNFSNLEESVTARLRRREKLNSQRAANKKHSPFKTSSLDTELVLLHNSTGQECNTKRKNCTDKQDFESRKKKGKKYLPDTRMSKEEETIWRRDARRKRNRDSARASRARVQQRLHHLESELNLWKQKYFKLHAKLEEQLTPNNKNNIISPCLTPKHTPGFIPLPSEIKIEGFSPFLICPPELVLSSTFKEVQEGMLPSTHLSEMISRPAVCHRSYLALT